MTLSNWSDEKNELKLQAECTQWFWNEFPDQRQMLHNNDNNSHNAIEGARKKAIGVVKGVSDLELILDGHVIFIELKVGNGKQSADQISFETKVRARGHMYIILYSFVEFKEFIINTCNL